MKKIFILTIEEFLVQNKIYNISKYFLIFYIFCLLSVTLINSYDNIIEFGMVFALASIPLGFLSSSASVIKGDIDDGTLELLKTCLNASIIVITKYLAFVLSIITSFVISIPIIYILFNLKLLLLIIIAFCGIILILLSSALAILIASMQGYFRINTNFFTLILLPLVIPSIILSGMVLCQALDNHINYHLIYILLGIDMIIIPVSLYLSTYLIDNIYNI